MIAISKSERNDNRYAAAFNEHTCRALQGLVFITVLCNKSVAGNGWNAIHSWCTVWRTSI